MKKAIFAVLAFALLVPGIAQARFLQADPVGYEDQVNLYIYVNNDPVNNLDPTGEKSQLAVHEVSGGYYHSKIVIIPDDQKTYRDDSRFQTNDKGTVYVTIGAGPDRPELMRPLGNLISNYNRSKDVSEPGYIVADILPGKGGTENALIESLFAADSNYKDNLDYDLFPSSSGDAGTLTNGYNSNSYIYGLLGSLGAKNIPTTDQAQMPTPGADKPVPARCFSRGNDC